jgi:hypothetical protein
MGINNESLLVNSLGGIQIFLSITNKYYEKKQGISGKLPKNE